SRPTTCEITPLLRSMPAHTQSYPPSLHDALPIYSGIFVGGRTRWETDKWQGHVARLDREDLTVEASVIIGSGGWEDAALDVFPRSEEHTSELQSRENLVCRLLLEKKKEQEAKQQ